MSPGPGQPSARAPLPPAPPERPADEFPDEDLLQPFRTRGPIVDPVAVRALARARGLRPHVRRRALPDDGSFDALIIGGLIDRRGRLTDNGLRVAEVMTSSSYRVRLYAAGSDVPLIFEAHLVGARALVLATPSPDQVRAGLGPTSLDDALRPTGPAMSRPELRVGLDLDSVSRLPLLMATWAGLQPAAGAPEQTELTLGWKEVQARFAPATRGAETTKATEATEATARTEEADGTDGADEMWSGWALSNHPATTTMTVIRMGEHHYRLSRPDRGTAKLEWISAEKVWAALVEISRPSTAGSSATGAVSSLD